MTKKCDYEVQVPSLVGTFLASATLFASLHHGSGHQVRLLVSVIFG